MRRAAPIEGIVRAAPLVGDRSDAEHRIDRRGARGVGRPGIIDDALQFLRVRQTPVAVAEVILRVLLFDPGQGFLPVHSHAAVGLRPHQSGSVVGDGAVAAGDIVVDAVVRVAANVADVLRLVSAALRIARSVSLDPPVGEVDAEDRVVAVHRGADVLGARPVLCVDDPLTGGRVAEAEIEVVGVDERRQPRRVGTAVAAGVDAAEVDQRVGLLDAGQPPVAVAAVVGRVERTGVRLGGEPTELVVRVDATVVVEVGTLRPGQFRVVVVDGQPVAASRVAGLVAVVLGILSVERGAFRGRGDLGDVVVENGLPRVYDDVIAREHLPGFERLASQPAVPRPGVALLPVRRPVALEESSRRGLQVNQHGSVPLSRSVPANVGSGDSHFLKSSLFSPHSRRWRLVL